MLEHFPNLEASNLRGFPVVFKSMAICYSSSVSLSSPVLSLSLFARPALSRL